MNMGQTLISFDLKGDFGVFKKPDVNEGLQLTFNMLHKPALLGILGAILGLEGYQKKGVFPDYYQKLRTLLVGIEPLGHTKGNFIKTVIKYTNTVGYANADGNLIITEQTLRSPGYRVYLLLDLEIGEQLLLHDRIWAAEAEYLPYFGKNECAIWWELESVQKYEFEPFIPTSDFRVNSVFIREGSVEDAKAELDFDIDLGKMINEASYISFERLPLKFLVGDLEGTETNEGDSTASSGLKKNKTMKFVQYDLAEFAYTDCTFRKNAKMPPLWLLKPHERPAKIIHLF